MKNRFALFDSYRGLLALIVATMHSDINATLLPLVFYGGYLGVEVFFVLSGFVLSFRYWDEIATGKIRFKDFLIARIARLYPLHLFTLAASIMLFIVVWYFAPGDEFPTISAWSNFLAIFLSHCIGLSQIAVFNNPSWSISVELYVNMLMFFIILLTIRSPMIFGLLAVIAYGLLYTHYHSLLVQNERALGLLNAGLLRGIGGISLGCFMFYLYQCHIVEKIFKKKLFIMAVEVILFAAVTYMLLTSRESSNFLLPPLAAMLILFGATGQGVMQYLLVNRPLQYLGQLSYSIYLNHKIIWIILVALKYKGIVVLPALAQQLVGFVLIIMMSYLTYHYIEDPGKRFFLRRFGRGKTPQI